MSKLRNQKSNSNSNLNLKKLINYKKTNQYSYSNSYDNKICLIVLGPTASGKSSLPLKVTKYLNLKDNFKKENYVSLLVDDLVENNPIFKKNITSFLNFLKEQYNEEQIRNIIINSNNYPKIIEEFNNIYYYGRWCTNCITGTKLPTYDLKNISEQRKYCDNLEKYNLFNFEKKSSLSTRSTVNLSCEELNDKNLIKGLNDNKNLLLETTGKYIPYWLLEDKMFKEKIKTYKIIMAWSVVDICELIIRNKLRVLNNFNKWLKDNNSSSPRLPNIKFEIYKKDLEVIVNTLIIFINEYNNKKVLNDLKIKLLIFDNNNKDLDIIYDNEMNPNINIKKITKELYIKYGILRKKCN